MCNSYYEHVTHSKIAEHAFSSTWVDSAEHFTVEMFQCSKQFLSTADRRTLHALHLPTSAMFLALHCRDALPAGSPGSLITSTMLAEASSTPQTTAKAPHHPAAEGLGTFSVWLPGTRRALRPCRLLGSLPDTE